jgi:hypothetical protein
LVVLVAIQTVHSVIFLESVSLEVDEQRRFDRDLILTDDEALIPANWLVQLVPRMLLDLLSRESLVWIGLHDLLE